jgi:hypothetical protein
MIIDLDFATILNLVPEIYIGKGLSEWLSGAGDFFFRTDVFPDPAEMNPW